MPDDPHRPPSASRPEGGPARRSPFDGFSRDEFEFRRFDTDDLLGQTAPRDEQTRASSEDAERDEGDADEDPVEAADPDLFMAVTVDGQTLKASPAPPITLAPRRSGAQARAARTRRRKPPAAASTGLQALRTILMVLAAAILVSTIFSLWTRPTFLPDNFRAGLNQVQATQHLINIQPSPLPTDVRKVRIGIVAGHSGTPQDETFNEDPGAVCPDGLTELSINTTVARLVVAALQRESYTVDLLEEFDPRLKNYRADALVSIHTNDCSDYGPAGTGYNAASAAARQTTRGADERLLNCLISQYGATTGLPRHYGITNDMTLYHTFSEVSSDTPTVIIELGYMRNDREILTQRPELVAQGVANGLRCFLRPDIYGSPPVAGQ